MGLPTTEGSPPLAKWHAIGTNISLVGKEKSSELLLWFMTQMPSGFLSNISEKTPLFLPIKYWSWLETIICSVLSFALVSTPIMWIVFLGNSLISDILSQFDEAKIQIEILDDNFYNQIESNNLQMLYAYDAIQLLVVYFKVDMLQSLAISVDYVDADGD